MKKKILIICPKAKDRQELALSSLSQAYDLHFHAFDACYFQKCLFQESHNTIDAAIVIDNILAYAKKNNVHGVISTNDYPGSIFAAIAADELGLPGPSISAVMLCQHKYHARVAQQKYVPEAVPAFTPLYPNKLKKDQCILPFPFFIKPVKSYFSIGAQQIDHFDQLKKNIQKSIMPAAFLQPFIWSMQQYTSYDASIDYVLAEELIEGIQATIEGYVFKEKVYICGIVDSIMYPGTLSFARFEYPSQIPSYVQTRMVQIAQRFMTCIGFDNGFFNIECIYNQQKDKILILEVNPRMASQFADLYQKVDGTNSYDILLALATGSQPVLEHKKGTYNKAASFALRIFENKQVRSVPSALDIKRVQQTFPDTRILVSAQPGKHLSALRQDGNSYLYCIINIGAQDHDDLLHRFECIKRQLPFSFVSVSENHSFG